MDELIYHKQKDIALNSILILSTAFTVVLVFFRIHYSGNFEYDFLLWNLFLAWIPYAISVILKFYNHRLPAILLVIVIGFWLLFFPNAPYIITDLFHLRKKHNIPLWYDCVVISSAAWNGLILGLLSLHEIQKIISKKFGVKFGWLLAGFSITAGSFGIYLGRFLRWNSWDIIISPTKLIIDILNRFIHPLAYLQTLSVTLLFTAFLFLAYLTLKIVMLNNSQ
ncbi:MAG: DUF1361 domain-containing protein [Candidatus Scalindua sp.]|nr:DUF1361 domain-containing protein [Candidatus Scalindua sp.]